MEYLEIMFNIIKTMKMRKVKYIYWAGVLMVTLFAVQPAIAQGTDAKNSPASVELLKAGSLWFHTTNGAGLTLDKMYNFSSVDFAYQIKNGDFKRVQDGDRERVLGVSSEGGQKLGTGYAWGKFSFNNEMQRNTQFNTTMLNPYRGMPYYPVDANISDWKKQDYNLEMKVASQPLWERVILGIQAQYFANTGAKQVDPRAETYYYHINIKPALVALFNNHAVGVNFVYENMVQESGTTNSNSQVNQDVYVMKGLGNYYPAVVGGLQSLGRFVYNRNKVGGALQYSYGFSDISFLLEGKYEYGVEDLLSTPTKPKNEASVVSELMEARLIAVKKGENLSRLELSYSSNNLDGIERIQVLDLTYEVQKWVDLYSSIRSTYKQEEISARFDFFRGAQHEYKWKAGLFTTYKGNDDVYILPHSRMYVKNMFFGADAKANFMLGGASKLLAGAGFTYKNNFDGKYRYRGADPNSIIITQFMTPDFEFMAQSYYKIGGELTFYTSLSKTSKAGLYLKAALDYYKPTEGESNRVWTNLGFGFTF
jgi:hypothetical protein